MVTLVEINDAFSSIATVHRQINTYGIGDPWELATSGTTRYPVMWATPDTGRMDDPGTYVSRWKVLLLDLVKSDESNETDVLSDMEQVALDVVALLTNPAFLTYDFHVDHTSVTIERVTEKFDDLLAGVLMTIEIRCPFNLDRCAVPQT